MTVDPIMFSSPMPILFGVLESLLPPMIMKRLTHIQTTEETALIRLAPRADVLCCKEVPLC